MPRNNKFQLLFKDRLGIVFDITQLMLNHKLNISCMEVEQKNGYARISLEINDNNSLLPSQLLQLFSTLPGIESQKKTNALPREKRAKWFRALFDGMSEGIVSINANGIIKSANSVACRILNTSYENLVNTNIREITPRNNLLMECMQKKIPVSRRKSALTETGRVDFYAIYSSCSNHCFK